MPSIWSRPGNRQKCRAFAREIRKQTMETASGGKTTAEMMSLFMLDTPGDEAVAKVTRALIDAGLCVMMSFDSSLTRTAATQMACPHHGEESCDCHMVILLVYGEGGQPATMMVHGQDGETWVSLVKAPGQQPDSCLEQQIKQALSPWPAG